MADLGFNTLITIQSSAFLMTLVRKNIIKIKWHMIIYSFCLAISSYYIIKTHDIYFLILSLIVFLED